ncbi:uncharacterized protein LOC113332072 isoform X2 [Papaver somniferum]|uniref:uncharacterized protein LOC113332072 isoform X2 n=1 Tax=Papaver somniferum TaxID=3469 RepID=UPI000E6F6BB2|nr:uncharacterized protein LOC113332072 isoform X2 [Papaver somniferum]
MAVVVSNCYNYRTTTTTTPLKYHSSQFLGRSSSLHLTRRYQTPTNVNLSKISAIFWGQKKPAAPQPHEMEVSLGTFTLAAPESDSQGVSTNEMMRPQKLSISVVSSISEIPSEDWDACAIEATGSDKMNPFLTHGFLSSLEETGCAVKFKVSSLHITFPSENEWLKMKDHGFLQRVGLQYHWRNRDYKNFDEFLMDMKQSKRKNVRQERKKISTQNLTMKRLRGHEIKAKHWDSFYHFYRSTTDDKWGRAYLTRDFFHVMGEKMGDQVLLVVAEDGDDLVAGALNLIGGDTIYGRLWGCLPQAYYPSLHFEACYYQAIEAAIELNLSKVEAGAQGEHKIQRGYLPVTTYSSHYILDKDFSSAIGDFVRREATQVKTVIKMLHDSGPFKEDVLKSLEE